MRQSDFAFILHKRAYKDSSELIKLLTQNHGIVDVIAKGSRKPKSKFQGNLQLFLNTEVFYSGQSDLKTLTDASQQEILQPCAYKNHVSMLYCNELLTLLRIEEEICKKVFSAYHKTIQQLQQQPSVSLVLRKFEWFLNRNLGYELRLPQGASATDHIEFNPTHGLQINNNSKFCQVSSLEKFMANELMTHDDIKQVNQLMKRVVNHMIHGKTIKSRSLLLN